MSVQLMSQVWVSDLPCGPKFVLMCLADNCGEMGECYPGIATISKKCSMTERTVQRHLRWLFDKSLIQEYWEYADKLRTKRVRHFRLLISGIPIRPTPNYLSCTPELRKAVIEHFGQTCTYCKLPGGPEKGPDGKVWEVDRIIPGSRGGKYCADNVTLSCRACNSSKRAKLAPPDTQSLGAKLRSRGCQLQQNRGAELAPEPSTLTINKPSGNPIEEYFSNARYGEVRRKRWEAEHNGTPFSYERSGLR